MSNLAASVLTIIIPGLSQLRSGNVGKAALIFITSLAFGLITGGAGWFLGGVWSLIDSSGASPAPARRTSESGAMPIHKSDTAQWLFKFALLAVCGGIAVYSISRGRALQSMEFLGVKMSFESSLGQLEKRVEDKQNQVQPEVEKIADPAPETKRPPVVAPPEHIATVSQSPIPANLSGTWTSAEGATYEIVHSGASVQIKEFSRIFYVPVQTAECAGSVFGTSVTANCATSAGVNAVAQLSVGPDGRSIRGEFRSVIGDVRIPVFLSR